VSTDLRRPPVKVGGSRQDRGTASDPTPTVMARSGYVRTPRGVVDTPLLNERATARKEHHFPGGDLQKGNTLFSPYPGGAYALI